VAERASVMNSDVINGYYYDIRVIRKKGEVELFKLKEVMHARIDGHTRVSIMCEARNDHQGMEAFEITPTALQLLHIYKKMYV